MTSPNQAGRASIEIIGDASKFGKQLKADVQRAVDNLDIDTTNIADEIGGGFEEAADKAADAFDDIDKHFKRTSRNVRRDADGMFDDIADGAKGAADSIDDGLVKPLRGSFGNLTNIVGSLGTALVGIASTSSNPAGLALLVAQVAALALAIPVVIGLAAALADLAGIITVLPGAIGALASSLIVGMVAFQGFGDAISAVIDGDPDKIAEAMEKLAPAAQKVVKEFQALLPLFRQVGDSIQQEFFEPLVGIVENFGQNALPRLRNELDILAQSMGRAFGHLGDLLTDVETVGILERLLASTARITDTLGAAFANLGRAFFNAIDAGLPSLEKLTSRLGDGINNFAKFINDSIEDGSFQEFFDDAVETMDKVLGLVGAIGELLGVLFVGTEDEGRDFIQTLTDLTQRLTEFFKSAEGKDAIQDFNELIQAAGSILGYVINAVRWVIDVFTELDDAVHATGDFFSDLWDLIVEVWNGITSAVSAAVDAVGQYFSDVWDYAKGVWNGLVETVGNAIDSVITFFSELPGKILDFITGIPEMIGNLFETMLDNALTVLAAGIAAVIVIFTDGPRQIAGAFEWLWARIVGIWNGIVDAVTSAIDSVITFFSELPARLAEIGQGILDWASTTWDTVVQTITDAVNSVVDFVSSLPGKIASFFQQAYDAVVTKLTSLVEFVKGIPGKILTALGNVGRMLFDSGKKIIQGLIDGINDKIGALKQKIADAVQAIRDFLPFSPAKTGPLSGAGSPDLAGAKIAAMIASGLESGLPLIRGAVAASAGALTDAGVPPLIGVTPGGTPPVLSPTTETTTEHPVFLLEIDGQVIEAVVTRVVDRRVAVEVRRLMAGTREI